MVEIRAPLVANVDITGRCNLHCRYCYAENITPTDMSTDVAVNLIDSLIEKHGVFHVTVAGGEPLLHPGIFDILALCFQKHGSRLVLLSNGTPLLNPTVYRRFAEQCEKMAVNGRALEMQISLDAIYPEVNDLQRGQGEKVLAAIERALALPLNLQLACVITKYNVEVADHVIEQYYPRVTNFHYMNLMPSVGGSRGSNYWAMLPTAHDVDAFHERILEKEGRFRAIRITKIKRDCSMEGGCITGRGCLAGTTRIDIGPNLDVRACCMSDEILGNLGRQTFEEMWHSEKAEAIRAIPWPYCFPWSELEARQGTRHDLR